MAPIKRDIQRETNAARHQEINAALDVMYSERIEETKRFLTEHLPGVDENIINRRSEEVAFMNRKERRKNGIR